jgi:hypothetical protein
MVMLDSARQSAVRRAGWVGCGLGTSAMLTASVAHGLGHGLVDAAVAVWPAVALVGSCELLIMVIRSAQVPGQPGARQLRAFLGTLDGNPAGCWGVRDAPPCG